MKHKPPFVYSYVDEDGNQCEQPMTEQQVQDYFRSAGLLLFKHDPAYAAKLIEGGLSLELRGQTSAEYTNDLRQERAAIRGAIVRAEFARLQGEHPWIKSVSQLAEKVRQCPAVIEANGGEKPSLRTVTNDLKK